MELREKHVYESNLLAFKFACIVQAFEILSTIVYQLDRIMMPTTLMIVLQSIIIAASVFGFIKYNRSPIGKYFLMICLALNYSVVLLGSVHVPYLWAF